MNPGDYGHRIPKLKDTQPAVAIDLAPVVRIRMNTLRRNGLSDDNFRNDCEYLVEPVGDPVLNKCMWFRMVGTNSLLRTEILFSISKQEGVLKSRNAKYTMYIQ